MLILIADDEAPARRELIFFLAALWPEAETLEARDGVEALSLIGSRPVDIAFLDINMPEVDGLQVAAALQELPTPPALVFATAYNEHALRAFELAAFDYIVKPIDERRLARTVDRLKQTVGTGRPFPDAALQTLLDHFKPSKTVHKLWGERTDEIRRLIDFEEIYWLESRDKRVWIGTKRETLQTTQSLKALAERLPCPPFIQVHRSYIVNIEKIAEVEPWFSGGYLLRLRNEAQTEVPLSRRFAGRFKELTNW